MDRVEKKERPPQKRQKVVETCFFSTFFIFFDKSRFVWLSFFARLTIPSPHSYVILSECGKSKAHSFFAMPPMLIQALGVLAVICWCCLFIPRLYENYKRSSTQGLSLSMCLLWCLSGIACVAYLIYEDANIALIIQFALMSFGSLLTIGQIFFYDYLKTCSLMGPQTI
jgi:hypothetical protein